MGKNTLNITLSLDTVTRDALEAESIEQHVSINRLVNDMLTRRYTKPGWPEQAEATVLAAELERTEAERERARDSAILHEASGTILRNAVATALADGSLVASRSFLTTYGFDPAHSEVNQ